MRILTFGDSFVAAANRGRPGYARLTPLLLASQGRHMGSGGTGFVKTSGARPAYSGRLAAMLAQDAETVIVQASGNDASCDLDEVRAAARDFLAVARDRFTRVFVLGPMWAIEGRENLPALRDTLQEVCDDLGISFIDALGWLSSRWIGPDGAHPTWSGHVVIAFRLARAIAALRRARPPGPAPVDCSGTGNILGA